MDDGPQYYFAYGANMNTRVLVRRGLQWVGGEAGVLDGYGIHFAVPGLPFVEPGFLTVREEPDACVYGVLYEMSAADLKRLDGYEAEQERFEVSIRVADRTIRATTYRSKRFKPGLKPSRRYKKLVIDGAREHDLPDDWIARFEAQSAAYVPLLSEYFALTMWVMERVASATNLWGRINDARLGTPDDQ